MLPQYLWNSLYPGTRALKTPLEINIITRLRPTYPAFGIKMNELVKQTRRIVDEWIWVIVSMWFVFDTAEHLCKWRATAPSCVMLAWFAIRSICHDISFKIYKLSIQLNTHLCWLSSDKHFRETKMLRAARSASRLCQQRAFVSTPVLHNQDRPTGTRRYPFHEFNAFPTKANLGRPANPAFFNANPIYFNIVMLANHMMRQHDLPFHFDNPNDAPFVKMTALPTWMSIQEMANSHNMKLDEQLYDDIIFRLNMLFTKQEQDEHVAKFLQRFVKKGVDLKTMRQVEGQVDQDGKSHTWGNRKSARAQVWMIPGDGQVFVNGTPLHEFFAEKRDKLSVLKPLVITERLANYNIWATVENGGPTGESLLCGWVIWSDQ